MNRQIYSVKELVCTWLQDKNIPPLVLDVTSMETIRPLIGYQKHDDYVSYIQQNDLNELIAYKISICEESDIPNIQHTKIDSSCRVPVGAYAPDADVARLRLEAHPTTVEAVIEEQPKADSYWINEAAIENVVETLNSRKAAFLATVELVSKEDLPISFSWGTYNGNPGLISYKEKSETVSSEVSLYKMTLDDIDVQPQNKYCEKTLWKNREVFFLYCDPSQFQLPFIFSYTKMARIRHSLYNRLTDTEVHRNFEEMVATGNKDKLFENRVRYDYGDKELYLPLTSDKELLFDSFQFTPEFVNTLAENSKYTQYVGCSDSETNPKWLYSPEKHVPVTFSKLWRGNQVIDFDRVENMGRDYKASVLIDSTIESIKHTTLTINNEDLVRSEVFREGAQKTIQTFRSKNITGVLSVSTWAYDDQAERYIRPEYVNVVVIIKNKQGNYTFKSLNGGDYLQFTEYFSNNQLQKMLNHHLSCEEELLQNPDLDREDIIRPHKTMSLNSRRRNVLLTWLMKPEYDTYQDMLINFEGATAFELLF